MAAMLHGFEVRQTHIARRSLCRSLRLGPCRLAPASGTTPVLDMLGHATLVREHDDGAGEGTEWVRRGN